MHLIEFVGMPRSGKSTQAELLKKALEAKGRSVRLLADRERMASLSVPPQESLAFALAFYGQLLDAYYAHTDSADVMIVDRGWSDAPVWSDVYRAMKVVTDAEAAALSACFARFAGLASAVVHVRVPVGTALERHRATLHEQVDDVAMNADWLAALDAAYARRKAGFTNLCDVDGTLPVQDVHQEILAFVEKTAAA